MSMNNLSTLLKSDNVAQAVTEARNNMLKSMVSSGAQDSGWGTLEVFLVKLCSLFSERCKNVSATLTDIQCAIDDFKGNRYSPDGRALSNVEQGVFNLWLAKEIYRKLGADMYFQVNMDAGSLTGAKLILNGQSTGPTSSIWREGELYCEIDITVAEAEIFKALAGDVLPEQGIIPNPYTNTETVDQIIQDNLSFKSLTQSQEELAKRLIGLSTNCSSPSMKLISRASDALEAISTYINANNIVGSDSDKTLTSATFRNMYAKTTLYTMEDFLAVSLPVIDITEKIGRQIVVEQTVQRVNEYASSLMIREDNVSKQINDLIETGVNKLKTVAFDFAAEFYNTIKHDETKYFDKDDWENSLEILPKNFQRKFRRFIGNCDEYNQSPSKGSFDKLVKLVTELLNSGKQLYTSELTGKKYACQKQEKDTDKIAEDVASKKAEIEQYFREVNQLREKLCVSQSAKEGKYKEVQSVSNHIDQLREQIDKFCSNKKTKNTELNELKIKTAELQQKLSDCEESQKVLLDECCSELGKILEKLKQQDQHSTRIEADFNEQIDLSNRVTAKAKNKNFVKEFVQVIVENGKANQSGLGDISLESIENEKRYYMETRESVVTLLNKYFNRNPPYFVNQFDEIIQQNKILELVDGTNSATKGGIKPPLKFDHVNDENLRNFLKKLDKEYIDREKKSKGVFDRFSHETEKAVNNSFDDRFDVIRYRLDAYISVYNRSNQLMTDREILLKSKQDCVDVLNKTVHSMEQIIKEFDNSLSGLNELNRALDSDNSRFDSMPEEVRLLTLSIKVVHQTAFTNLMDKKNEFKDRTERLLTVVLPKLIDSDGVYQFNNQNLEGSHPLDEQDIKDIQWCAEYMKYNGVSAIAEHQMENSSFAYDTFLKEKEQCQKEFEELIRLMNDLSNNFKNEFDGFEEKIKELKESINNNYSKEQAISEDINKITAAIEEHSSEITEQQGKVQSLQKEINLCQKEINEVTTRISKYDNKINKLNEVIIKRDTDLYLARKKLAELKDNITNFEILQEYVTSEDQTQFSGKVQSIKVRVDEYLEQLNKQEKELQDGQEFLATGVKLLNEHPQIINWRKTGCLTPPKNGEENDYEGIIFDTKIPDNANGGESIKFWNVYGYQTFNMSNDKTKIRTTEEVAKDAVAVDEGAQFLEEVQKMCFERLFAFKDSNTLISDVYKSLKDFVGQEETPDFKSLSRYIEHCYNAVKTYEKLQREGGNVIGSVEAKDITEWEAKLYKAQSLFGINMIMVFTEDRFKEVFRNKELNIDIINADINTYTYSQIYKSIHNEDREFNKHLNEWRAIRAISKINDTKPILNYLSDVFSHQEFQVASAIKTGRVELPGVTSKFVAPSIQQLIKMGAVSDQKGIHYLFSLTDVASGVVTPDIREGRKSALNPSYTHLSKERIKWIGKNPDFNQQVFLACDQIGLHVKGMTTPEV